MTMTTNPSNGAASRTPPTPSNAIVLEAQSQWLFTDAELQRTPSILDGMTVETEHINRSKGVSFITQVGIMLKLPQLTLLTADIYLHRFFMRYSMVNLPNRPGMHYYAVAATALFLASKVEENCRKMRELIIAACRVAQKQPNLVVDEQSKEYWRWRDTILASESTLLEALCFDLQVEQPHRLLFDFLCFFRMDDNKLLRNAAWAFINDVAPTVLCLQFTSRTIAAAAIYASARHTGVAFRDDDLGRPWWEQIAVDVKEVRAACNRIAEIYERSPLGRKGDKELYVPTAVHGDAADNTRMPHSTSESPPGGSDEGASGRKRERESEDGAVGGTMERSESQLSNRNPANGAPYLGRTQSQSSFGQRTEERSPKRLRRSSSPHHTQHNQPPHLQSNSPDAVQARIDSIINSSAPAPSSSYPRPRSRQQYKNAPSFSSAFPPPAQPPPYPERRNSGARIPQAAQPPGHPSTRRDSRGSWEGGEQNRPRSSSTLDNTAYPVRRRSTAGDVEEGEYNENESRRGSGGNGSLQGGNRSSASGSNLPPPPPPPGDQPQEKNGGHESVRDDGSEEGEV